MYIVVQLSSNIYTDDLNIFIFRYERMMHLGRMWWELKFLCWTQKNKMKCNQGTCKELIISKREFNETILPLQNAAN